MTRAVKNEAVANWRSMLASPIGQLCTKNIFVQVAAAVAVISVIVALSIKLWQRVEPHVATRPEYLMPAEKIEITPAPEWIHTNLQTEVIRDSGLKEPLSILDDKLTARLTQAFSLHPWIARVAAVRTSYPPRIQVDIEYRRPVAMVEVLGGLLPIDVDGVLLPTEDFSPPDAQNYPRIAGIVSGPLGPLGTRWGDPAVEAAAKLAPVLQPVWTEFRLHHVQLQSRLGPSAKFVLELVAIGGNTFVWGSPPGSESNDESIAAEKLALLTRLKNARGSLADIPATERDLRKSVRQN
jgi:hypothetical protein